MPYPPVLLSLHLYLIHVQFSKFDHKLLRNNGIIDCSCKVIKIGHFGRLDCNHINCSCSWKLLTGVSLEECCGAFPINQARLAVSCTFPTLYKFLSIWMGPEEEFTGKLSFVAGSTFCDCIVAM